MEVCVTSADLYFVLLLQCQVLYIDYGNSEILNRSDIVEIPPNLQYPSVAKKYRLWGLQIPTNQNLDTFDLVSNILEAFRL